MTIILINIFRHFDIPHQQRSGVPGTAADGGEGEAEVTAAEDGDSDGVGEGVLGRDGGESGEEGGGRG